MPANQDINTLLLSDSSLICCRGNKLQGAGDKKGSGKCACESGYSGEFCSDCAERHFKSFSNETYTLCTRK